MQIEWIRKAVGGCYARGYAGALSSLSVAGVSTDSRDIRHGDLFIALRGPSFDGHDFLEEVRSKGARAAIVEKRPSPRAETELLLIEVADSRRALADLASAHRRTLSVQVVGITGSCGKTSTKNILQHVLEPHLQTVASAHSYNNEIGVPLTLLQIGKDCEVAIVEIGTSAPGEVAPLARLADPSIGLITNIFESHLAGLTSLDGIADEKADLLRELPRSGLAVVNADCPRSSFLKDQCPAPVATVGLGPQADYRGTELSFSALGTTFLLDGAGVTIPLLGTHFVHDVLFAVAVAERLGIDRELIVERLRTLPVTPRRLERKVCGDVVVIDDTYNANPGSVRPALQALAGMAAPGRRIAVLGDMRELGAMSRRLHEEIGREVAAHHFDLILTVGSESHALHAAARFAGGTCQHFEEIAGLIAALSTLVEPRDLILVKGSNALALDRVVKAIAELRQRECASLDAGQGG